MVTFFLLSTLATQEKKKTVFNRKISNFQPKNVTNAHHIWNSYCCYVVFFCFLLTIITILWATFAWSAFFLVKICDWLSNSQEKYVFFCYLHENRFLFVFNIYMFVVVECFLMHFNVINFGKHKKEHKI